ncbi:hypothetical protein A1O1_05163 [Capronia coronata CBS 617.96]|uniref:BHLH domain-containing protein n=1 Tax=Capronia coronata CBS 617.96 TaxID=1182541 RepID=W9Y6S1_9EURO|nr:uncharacterized protein A1O1_05163 [Capronia coronata CBS 617.96]EXJ88233.1 hypothetical protein A1O1_05163 [Capronia coronata CBS 617.96]
MNQEHEQNVVWPQDIQQDDSLVAGVGNDDFTKFLDLDNDFQHFSAMDNGHSGLDTPMGRLGFGNSAADLTFTESEQMHMNMAMSTTALAYQDPAAADQTYGQYSDYQQMQMAGHYHVPPTPVSAEMQAAKYAPHMGNNGQLLFDHQQMSFTPLVSPAQTPLDGVFSMADYGLADDFFSPLTSPAIEAQAAFSSTGTTASPIDLGPDAGALSQPAIAGAKRPRRKGNGTARTPARGVRQSPALKAQPRRRHPSLSSLRLDKMGNLPPHNSQEASLHVSAPNSAVIRPSDDSISPESLSEVGMGPPPVPLSGSSPQPRMTPQDTATNNPVTPATLMSMPSNPSMPGNQVEQHGSAEAVNEPMEDIMLPDAAAPVGPPVLTAIDTIKTGEDSESTPTLSAKSAKLSAASTPRGAVARGNLEETFAKPGIPDFRGGSRANKKRQSTSSATISPALRPKISPSINPLAPATGPTLAHLSPETSALYLASKSNYQNILEGTHLPGVSYPETLAENLTSKRTSHKLAEQGRRNRINVALKEIEALLPSAILAGQAKKDGANSQENEEGESKPTASGPGASKASTVEMAIVYIKSLQTELKETKSQLEVAEKKLAEGGGSSGGSQTSDG